MRPQYPLDPKTLFVTAFARLLGLTHWDKLSRARGEEGFLALNRLGRNWLNSFIR